jgi:nicotinamide riboside kinase
MICKVLLTGTTSCGKTTLINSLKSQNNGDIVFVEEEARKFLELNPHLERDPQLQDYLFARQVEAEQNASLSANRIVICDRGVPDNIAHALMFRQPIKPEWVEWAQTYDIVLALNPSDINYDMPTELQLSIDPSRNWGEYRMLLDEFIFKALEVCQLKYQVLSGTVEGRLQHLTKEIGEYTVSKEGGNRPLAERK